MYSSTGKSSHQPNNLLLQAILESLRMSSIISFTFREAVVDVFYDGKNWYSVIYNDIDFKSAHIIKVLMLWEDILVDIEITNTWITYYRIFYSKRMEGDAII